MAIGLRASGSTTGDVSSASATVTKPAAAVTGDIAILTIGLNMLSPSTTLTGWTLVGSISFANASTVVFQRAVQSGDTTWSYTPGGGAQQFGYTFQTFTGVDLVTPIDATGTANSASGTTVVANAVTIATDQAWELIGVGSFNGGGTAPSFTALNNGATPTNEGACLLYNQTPKSVGSTGTVTVTTTSGAKSAVPFALRPAAAATVDYPAGSIQIPNRNVGPMALRLSRHSPVPIDLTLAPPTVSYFAPLARVPNNRVGPMPLRALYRQPTYPFDSTAAASTANRLRRAICSGA